MNLDRIRENLESVNGRIAEAARRAGRDSGEVTLVAVTKKVASDRLRPLVEAGAKALGENYPQELWRKVEDMGDMSDRVYWHLIGHLQGNKVRRTIPLVTMVHAVDSLKLLRSLDEIAAELSDPPRVCLQVNTSGEEAKHGWAGEAILSDGEAIASCRNIPIAGLMTLAAWGTSADTARPSFALLRRVRDDLSRRTGLPLPELSMGMSGDFEAAIAEGATIVRIGSALFEGVES